MCAGITLFLANIGRHNAFYDASIVSGRLVSTIIFNIYHKMLRLSQFTVKSAEIGKITNLLSNDISSIELKTPVFFAAIIFPVGIIGVLVMLVTRFGPVGLIALGVTALVFPFQAYVASSNGERIQNVNIYKDERIKVTTEII